MRLLITAGNTLTPIDRVRGLTNIFSGRTGASIARAAADRQHAVTLLTSHPEALTDPTGVNVLRYRTFAELATLMEEQVRQGGFDGLIHSAAVSDYHCAGVYSPSAATTFNPTSLTWSGTPPMLVDRAAGKVKSDEPELWLRLTRAPKLVDAVRREWGFRGMLVKFKLEVGLDDAALLAIAERSRQQSAADFMVANTLDGAPHYAFIGPLSGDYLRVTRRELADRLLDYVEAKHGMLTSCG